MCQSSKVGYACHFKSLEPLRCITSPSCFTSLAFILRLKVRSIAAFPSHPSHTVPYAMPHWDGGLRDEWSRSFGHVLANITQTPAETDAWPPHMAMSLAARAWGRAGCTLTHIYNWLHTITHFPPLYFVRRVSSSQQWHRPAPCKALWGIILFQNVQHWYLLPCAAILIVTSKTQRAVLWDQSVVFIKAHSYGLQ